MVGRIDAASRVNVFVPSPADLIVFFKDDERNAKLHQIGTEGDPAGAGPDDNDGPFRRQPLGPIVGPTNLP